jgi:hypothetical protein
MPTGNGKPVGKNDDTVKSAFPAQRQRTEYKGDSSNRPFLILANPARSSVSNDSERSHMLHDGFTGNFHKQTTKEKIYEHQIV